MTSLARQILSSPRAHSLALVGILFLAGSTRLFISLHRDWVGYDEANYLMIARNADAGLGYTPSPQADYHPKFHLLVIFVVQVLGRFLSDGIVASKAVFILGGLAGTLLIALLGRALFGRREGLLGALLFGVAPALTSLTSESISHSIYTPLFLLSLWFAWKALDTSSAWAAGLAGVALGLGWWARADGLVAAPCLLLFLIVGGGLLGRLKDSAITASVFGSLFSLTYWANQRVVAWMTQGREGPHGPLYDFLVYPPDCESTKALASYGSFLELVLAEPQCVLSKVEENLDSLPGVFLTWTGMSILLLVLTGVALGGEGERSARSLARDSLLFFGVLPISFYLLFYVEETRYVSPYVGLMLIWCARGTLLLGERLRAVGGQRAYVVMPLLVIMLLSATTVLHSRRLERLAAKELESAGRWIAENSEPEAVVWTSQAEVAFFAERAWQYPPRPISDDLREPGSGQVLLVVDERNFEVKNPKWAKRVAERRGARLREVFRDGYDSLTVVVYEVLAQSEE